MLRGIILGLALLVVLAPAASAASTGHARPLVNCPELAGQPGCCGPVTSVRTDQTPCCPATAAACCGPIGTTTCCATSTCPSSLSIDVSPDPATEGHQATISGTLSGSGSSNASQKVDLWEKPAGQTAFSDVASTQTNASGAFSFLRTVTTNAQWYVKSGTVVSSTVTESVLAALVLHHAKSGTKLTLSGRIAPSHAGERVALQQLRRGRWITIARPKLGTGSRFTFKRKLSGRSIERFRIVLGADARNAQSVSSVVAVRA
jgi:hypothetical protein